MVHPLRRESDFDRFMAMGELVDEAAGHGQPQHAVRARQRLFNKLNKPFDARIVRIELRSHPIPDNRD